MEIEKKIEKIQAILRDPSASDGEKDVARKLLDKLQDKYAIDIEMLDDNKREWFTIKCKDEHEKMLLLRILTSYKLKAYLKKNCSRLSVLFYTTDSYFQIINAELSYHRYVLSKYLKSVTINYLHKFVLPYQLAESDTTKETDKLTDEAATAAAFMFYDKNYTARRLLV
ncbi:MAG: hypothetical protein J6B11_07665 [Spirochaetales bacterium]|nr:hypothetical protein [Spirochaetales bacterium]